jgi:hypothetical protein
MIGTILVASIYNNVCMTSVPDFRSKLLILFADYLSWKRVWSLRHVRHLLRHLHGLTGRHVCVAH